MRKFLGSLLLISWTGLAWAQVGMPGSPGQYPPGGQYPGGQYPGGQGGGLGLPFPGSGRRTSSGAGKDSSARIITVNGTVRTWQSDKFELIAEDRRVLTVRLTAKTKILDQGKESKADSVALGRRVAVDATVDDQGIYTALSLDVQPGLPGPAAVPTPQGEEATTAGDSDSATGPSTRMKPDDPARDTDDPGPPRIRRGVPEHRASTPLPEAETAAPVESTRVIAVPNGPVPTAKSASANLPDDKDITAARAVVAEYGSALPNYFCKQYTTRYSSSTRPVRWTAEDVVSADLVMENGREQYRNIAINNKPTKKPIEKSGGSWSTGDFYTSVSDLFAPHSQTQFRKRGRDRIGNVDALVYNFTVEQPHSGWTIIAPGERYSPGYKGTIWIDAKTHHVLRLEKQGKQLPEEFPFDTVEGATDFELVRIGGKSFLVPTHAEVLTCQRGTMNCSRNTMDFRNYRKFGSESDILFEAPQ